MTTAASPHSGGQTRRVGGSSPETALASSRGRPHSGQNRLRAGTAEPQLAQSTTDIDSGFFPFLPFFTLESLEGLGGLAPERTHERPVVLVGDLTRAVVELELL